MEFDTERYSANPLPLPPPLGLKWAGRVMEPYLPRDRLGFGGGRVRSIVGFKRGGAGGWLAGGGKERRP